jgi:long-chain acyl-CoA synthetase
MSERNSVTVPAKFKSAVARWGERVAMRKKELGLWHDITWNEYDRNVSHVAYGLMSMGLQKGDCAAIIGGPVVPEV